MIRLILVDYGQRNHCILFNGILHGVLTIWLIMVLSCSIFVVGTVHGMVDGMLHMALWLLLSTLPRTKSITSSGCKRTDHLGFVCYRDSTTVGWLTGT